MSADSVDELHHAEDTIGLLTAALQRVRDTCPPGGLTQDVLVDVEAAWLAGSTYCRLSCEHDSDAGWLCGDVCGCPAHHDPPGHAYEDG